MTLGHLGAQQLAIEFLNVRRTTDCTYVANALLAQLASMRRSYEDQIDSLVSTVTRLIQNRANEEMRATFRAATRPLRTWLAKNCDLAPKEQNIAAALVEEMDGIRYASTLRASVNRRGSWHNFDYWHGLGFGARRDTVARTAEQIAILRGLIETAMSDEELGDAHDFLRHFLKQVESAFAGFYQEAQSVGETVFFEQLREDHEYWDRCRGRWGGGPGYKSDIRHWTDDWFLSGREERHRFIEQEIRQRWREMMAKLDVQLSPSNSSDEEVLAA
jgi:hypothetical protein